MSKKLLPSDEELVRLYEEKKSCKEICRIYGLSTNSSTNVGIKLKN